jgi:hypothetical protein
MKRTSRFVTSTIIFLTIGIIILLMEWIVQLCKKKSTPTLIKTASTEPNYFYSGLGSTDNNSTAPKQKNLFFELGDIGDPEPNGYVQVNPETNELEYDVFKDAFDVEL